MYQEEMRDRIEADVPPASHTGWNLYSYLSLDDEEAGIEPLQARNRRMGNEFDKTMYNTLVIRI